MSDGRVRIDITGDTSEYEKAVKELGSRTQKQLSSISGTLDKAGGALTKCITAPAIGAATAVGSIFAVKGWQRLEAIDTAKSKLKGLGYEAQDISSIMDSALASVKGTAYGLGDAATVAVGALASGIRQGDDLTRVLKTIGDVATIAGGDFQGVASIFNKVMAKGKLQGDEILQLSEAGVPVLQILAKHLGVTAEEVSDLASQGEIGFATFEEAMRSAFGGAALSSGESMRGMIENTWAAVSRVGAAFLEGGESGQGFFNVLKPLLGELTEDIDGMSETAGEWGAAFGDAVLDGAQILRDLAAAFNELSPSEKRQAIEIAALVVAAGPLLKIGSKLISGGSAMVGVLSKSAQATDKMISSGRSLSTAYQKNLQIQNSYKKSVIGTSTAYYKWNTQTQSYVRTNSSLKAALLSTSAGHKTQAAAATLSARAMDAGKVAARGFSTALKSIAPIAVISGVIALVSAISSAARKTETYAKATAGLEDAASGATVEIDEETGAIERLGGAAGSVNLDRIAQEHADLAQGITDTNQSVEASAALLGGYGDAVEDLAGRSDLNAEQVASLKLAIDGINDSCGTSYTVAQDTGGAWQVMADGAAVAKDKILELVDAQLAQIRLDAQKENYKRTYEQLAKDTEAYSAALADATQKQAALDAKVEELGNGRYMTDTTGAIIDLAAAEQKACDEAKQGLADIESQMGSTQSAANRIEEQMKLITIASGEGAGEIEKLVAENTKLKAAIQGTGTDLVAFTQSLKGMGFTAEQVAAMTPEQAAIIAQAWRGGTEDMIVACQELGLEVPAQLNAMGLAAALETQAAGLSAGAGFVEGLSAEAQNAVGVALTTVGLSSEAFGKLATLAGIEGNEAAVAFANQLASGQVPAQLAAQLNVQGAQEGLSTLDGTETANETIAQYIGTLGSASNVNAANSAGKANADAGYEGISYRDGDFEQSGSHAGTNWANGLRSAKSEALRAAQEVMGSAASVMKFSVPDKGPFSGTEQGGKRSGQHLVQNIASGMLSESATLMHAASSITGLLQENIGRSIEQVSVPVFDIPVGLALADEDLRGLSAFSFAAALEDRSGRGSNADGITIDLSPVTDALGRIEERIDAAAERTSEAYRRPVRVDLNERELGRVVRELI